MPKAAEHMSMGQLALQDLVEVSELLTGLKQAGQAQDVLQNNGLHNTYHCSQRR